MLEPCKTTLLQEEGIEEEDMPLEMGSIRTTIVGDSRKLKQEIAKALPSKCFEGDSRE